MDPAEIFEQERTRLLRLAYSMLGSLSEAKDIVQDAYLKWSSVNDNKVHSPSAFLSTMVSRLCLDQLKSARVRRREYIGTWLPEPVVTSGWQKPDIYSELTESLTIAMLHVMEQLTPVQRAVFLLHDVFDYSFNEIAEILGRSPESCRKAAQRSRESLKQHRPEKKHTDGEHQDKIEMFIRGIQSGDIEQVKQVLAKDAILYSDGGGKVAAVRKPITGQKKINRFLKTVTRKAPPDAEVRFVHINGKPGLATLLDGSVNGAWTFHFNNSMIERIYIIRNPEKLKHVQL